MSNRKKIYNDEKDEKWFEIVDEKDKLIFQKLFSLQYEHYKNCPSTSFKNIFVLSKPESIKILLREEITENGQEFSINLFTDIENCNYTFLDSTEIEREKQKLDKTKFCFQIVSLTDLYKRAKRLKRVSRS